jgi:Protein of unknown function (DUF3445)
VFGEGGETFNLEGEVRQVGLDVNRAAGRKGAQFDGFLAARGLQEDELRAAGRLVPTDFVEAQDLTVEPDGTVEVVDAITGVEQAGNAHDAARLAVGGMEANGEVFEGVFGIHRIVGWGMDFAWEPPWTGLGRLWEGEAYRFQFHLRPGRPGWMELGAPPESVLAERRAVLSNGCDRALVWSDAADECWDRVEGVFGDSLRDVATAGVTARERASRVAAVWAPDFLLLRRDGDEFRFVGGAVCFPSGWDPVEKLGRTVMEIHGPVPGLNEALGARIGKFLGGVQAGQVFERENWGLAATGVLDLHPEVEAPRLRTGTPDSEVWFRLEEQAFVGVPGGEVLLFLIHVRTWPLLDVLAATGSGVDFDRMLASMPADVAAYKGLTEWLAGRGGR